jgi:hypothetical protein
MIFLEAGTQAIFILCQPSVSTHMLMPSHRCFRFYRAATSPGQFFMPMQIAAFLAHMGSGPPPFTDGLVL